MHHAKCILTTILLLLNVAAFGQAGANKFRFSGRLSDNGILIGGGFVDLRFRVFELPSGGSQIGADVITPNIFVTNGTFSVIVNLSEGPYVNGQSYWVEAGVRFVSNQEFFPYTTLSPRKQITIGASHGLRMFREPGTNYFVVPAGVHQMPVEAWSAGGGGADHGGEGGENAVGGSRYYLGGGGGGGGGYAKGFIPVTPGTTISIVVGAGGFPGTNTLGTNHSNGFKGGDTKVFGPGGNILLKLTGGLGGTNRFSANEVAGNVGGSGGLGDTNMPICQNGQAGVESHTTYTVNPPGFDHFDIIRTETGGNGGSTVLGSVQSGKLGYNLEEVTSKDLYFYYEDGVDTITTIYDTSVTIQPITFGHGGRGGGYAADSPPNGQASPESGSDGCVILQW